MSRGSAPVKKVGASEESVSPGLQGPLGRWIGRIHRFFAEDVWSAEVDGAGVVDRLDPTWVRKDFIPTVAGRGSAIIDARGASSAASAANAAVDHMRSWALGSDDGDWVSMGIYSDGSYGIQEGLIYSYPCVCKNGDWEIVQGLEVNDFSRERMTATETELAEERDAVKHLLP